MSKVLPAIALVGLVGAGLPACATKKFVRQGVGEVNRKVDALGHSPPSIGRSPRSESGRAH